jgi:DNA-binding SARP family transcriptional activator/KaiC/GvpD/RAD55 family RecA-like ATPase
MVSLQIYLLGNFQILFNHHKILSDLWQSRQLRTILKILIIQRGKPVPASQIIEKIWPDKDPEQSAQHLYVRISQIRKLLKNFGFQDCIQTVAGGYIFQCEPFLEENEEHSIWIDVVEFERMADQGREQLEKKEFNQSITRFKKALNLYRADFLIEDLYEDWSITERERLRDRHLMVLTEMAEAYAQTGRYRHAIDVSQKVLSVDPCRESTFVQLMLYYYHLGERSKSLDVFERCKTVLSEEMDVNPDTYTEELAQKIRVGDLGENNGNGKYPPSVYTGRLFEVPYSLSETPFIGRKLEYSWLVQQLQNPHPTIVWVKGESGVGKTRLLEEFIHQIDERKIKVVKIYARTIENSPYAIWIALLKKYSHALDSLSLPPETRTIIDALLTGDSKESSLFTNPAINSTNQQFQNTIETVFQLMLPHGSIIWIDDIHLADPASLSLLKILEKNFFILISSMSEEEHESPHFEDFLINQSKSITTLTLQRWQISQVASFIENLSGNAMPTLSESLFSITGGNPLFLINTLQHLFEEGILYVNPQGDWQQTQPILLQNVQTLENLIPIRLNKNTKDEQRILDVISVAGGECDYEILQDVLEIQESRLIDLTDRLIQRGLLIEPRKIGEAELTFSHFIYKDVIYQSLPKPRLKRFHKRIGDAMVQGGRSSGQYAEILANHFASGGDYGKAARYSLAAGEYLRNLYAPQQAIPYYENAIQWFSEENNPDTIAQSRFGLAEALRLTGESTRAIESYQLALPLLKGEIKQAAIYQIFQLQVLKGNPLSTYQEIADKAEHSISEEGISWALPLLFWSHSFVFLLMGDYNKTRLYHAKGWRIARQLYASGNIPPTWVYNRALTLMMRAHNQWGNYQTSIHFSQKNLALLPSSTQDVNTRAVIDASLAESYYNLGDYKQATDYFHQSYKLANKAGDLRLQGEILIGLGWLTFEIGDFTETQTNAKKVLNLVERKPDILRHSQAKFLLAKTALIQNKLTSEYKALENILLIARFQGADPYTAQCLIILAEIYLNIGQPEQAEIFAREAKEIAERCGSKRVLCTSLRSLGQARLQQGDLQNGLLWIDKSVFLADQIQVPFEKGLSLRARAECQDDLKKSLQDAQQALKMFEKIGSEFEALQTHTLLTKLNLKNTGDQSIA